MCLLVITALIIIVPILWLCFKMFLSVILLGVPLIWIWYRVANRRKLELAARVPGPKTVPLLGNGLLYLNKEPEDILGIVSGMEEQFGDFYRVWVGPFHVAFFISNPKDVEVLLSSNKVLKKNNLYNHLIPWLGTGLLIADGKKWHARRKVITPTFHFKILEQFLVTFNKKGQKMVSLMRNQIDTEGGIIDVYPFINSCTLDIICETAMGIEFNSMDNPNTSYVKAVVRISEITASRFVKVWMRPDVIFRTVYRKLKKEFDGCIRVLHDFTNGIINERRQKFQEKNIVDSGSIAGLSSDPDLEGDDAMGIKKKMALLDVLINSTVDGRPLSTEEIREEVDTFMFEGHDTTTSAICFSLYVISKHPDVQQKIYEELENVLGDQIEDKGLSYSDLGELKYLELVIKEVLRMYPPVPMFGRHTEEELEINGKTIPAFCNIIVAPYLIGRNPEIFPEPEKFIPERFTKENMQEKNPFSFVAFSAGPRNCIGQKFAMNELKSILSKVLYTFELYPSGLEPILSTELVLRSKNGFKIGMRRRK